MIIVNFSFMYDPTNAHSQDMFNFACPLLSTPTCFSHFSGHLQGVTQYKYQEYNRS